MADTYNIRFIADSAPIRRAERDLRGVDARVTSINRSADRLGQTLGRAFAVGAVVAAAGALGRLADQATNIDNRIRAAGIQGTEFSRIYAQLRDISLETRSSFAANAQVFSRVAVGLRQYGITSREAAGFVRSLNQAVAIGGSSAQEAEASIRQLAQGLDAGALRGDEFRSVMEQLPIVADIIARRFRVTRGELRALAEAGRLTGDEIIAAFSDAQEELDRRFALLTPTIAQGFQQINTGLLDYVRNANQATGVSRTLAFSLGGIANNLGPILDVVTLAGVAGLGGIATRRVGRIAGGGVQGIAQLRQAGVRSRQNNLLEDNVLPMEDLGEYRRLGHEFDNIGASAATAAAVLGGPWAIAVGVAGVATLGFISYIVSARRELRQLRTENEAAESSFAALERERGAVLAGVSPESNLRRPGETEGQALIRASNRAREARRRELQELQGRQLEAFDRLSREQDALSARQLPEGQVSRGVDLRRIVEINEQLRERAEGIREVAQALTIVNDPFTSFIGENERASIALDLTDRALDRINNRYSRFEAEQRIAAISNEDLRRSFTSVLEAGIDPFAMGVEQFIRGEATDLDEAGQRIISRIIEMGQTAERSNFGDVLAEQASRARQELDSFNQSLTQIRDNLQFESFLDASQSGAGRERLGFIYNRLGIRSVADLERFYERSDAGDLLRLAGREFDNRRTGRAGTSGGGGGGGEIRFPTAFERFQADAREQERLFGFSPRERETEAILGRIRRLSAPGTFAPGSEDENTARSLIETNRRLAESYNALESATDAFTTNLDQGFHDFFTGAETSFRDGLRSITRGILSDLAQQTISRHITGPLSRSIFSGLGSAFGLGGARLGGTYTVPGSGPADSAMFAARVTPGETVTFTPPGERFGGDAGIGGGRTVVQNFNFPPQTNVQSMRRNRRALQREALRFVGAR